jgi:hypothetical protein
MRQVFTSPRMENIDRVVELLNAAGIATHIGNRSVYQGSNFKRFSYSARVDSSAWPQVWVVRSDDQVQARALLREAGLEPATRFSAELALERSTLGTKPLVAKFSYLRVLLLIGLAVSMIVAALRMSGAS